MPGRPKQKSRSKPSANPRASTVRAVCSRLHKSYESPRLGNPSNSVADLVYVIASNRTSPSSARTAFQKIKKSVRQWKRLREISASDLRRLLRPAGLSNIKSRHLKGIARRLQKDLGVVSLTPLRRRSDDEVEAYLTSLPGVSTKVARCVMMYTMRRDVLPVDVHVHRISKRLGWTKRKRADQCHEDLDGVVPPHLRFGFHVNCICHGREICTPRNPACHRCPIYKFCTWSERGKSILR